MKFAVVYYSMYGHIHAMAQAAVAAAAEVPGTEAALYRVPETLSPEILAKMGATESTRAMAAVPTATPDVLGAADAVLFGTPTRFGNMCGQMRQFMDSTGGLWVKGALVGKPGGVFSSSNTQHGGQESTILTFIPTLLHLGMVIVGLPYSFQGQMGVDEVLGGSPYGASTIAGSEGERRPSGRDLDGVRYQARHLAEIGHKLAAK